MVARVIVLSLVLVLGCGSSKPACIEGQSAACACTDGATGAQVCTSGAFAACTCAPRVAASPVVAAAPPKTTGPGAPTGYQCGEGKAVAGSGCNCPDGMSPARDDDNTALCVKVAPASSGSAKPPSVPLPATAARTLRLIKVSGEGQAIAANGWSNFAVRVVDGSKPVAGVRIAWSTPALGPRTFIGVTDAKGTSSATNLYTGAGPAALTQIAGLALGWTGAEWSDEPVPTTMTTTFKFTLGDKPKPSCASFAGAWIRAEDGFILDLSQTGCAVSGKARDGRHVVQATAAARTFAGFTHRTDGDGCQTRLHVTMTLIDDDSFEHRTTATDGKCGLPADFTERDVFRRVR